MRQQDSAPENTKSFIDRIWLLDDEIREKKRAIDMWMAINANTRRRILDENCKLGSWCSNVAPVIGSWDERVVLACSRPNRRWTSALEVVVN